MYLQPSVFLAYWNQGCQLFLSKDVEPNRGFVCLFVLSCFIYTVLADAILRCVSDTFKLFSNYSKLHQGCTFFFIHLEGING
jgi:hypothetical protein